MGRSSTTDHKRFSSIGIIKSRRVFCAFHRKHSYYFHKQANSCGEAKRRKKLNLKKYQNTSRQMVGWNSKTILRKPSCVFVLLKWNLTLKKMNHESIMIMWDCVLSSRMVVWHCTVSTLVCLHSALRPLYFICDHYSHTNKHTYFSLQSHIYGISKQCKCHVCHHYNNRSAEVQNNTNLITAAVTFINIYISMKAVMILLFR